MKENSLWQMIDEIGWGRKTTDYDAVAKEILAKWGKEKVKMLRKFVSDRVADLQKAVKKFEEENGQLEIGSDDGFSDVTHHIVGMGFIEWGRAVANPKRVEERYNAKYGSFEGYKESFSYCFLEPMAEPSPADELAFLRKQQDDIMAEIQRLTEVANGLSHKIFLVKAKMK